MIDDAACICMSMSDVRLKLKLSFLLGYLSGGPLKNRLNECQTFYLFYNMIKKIFPGNRLAFVLYISGLGRRRRISDEELAWE